jgi:predicted phage terminase large subunit-like protein
MLTESEFKLLSDEEKLSYLRETEAERGRVDLQYLAWDILGYRDKTLPDGRFEPGVSSEVHGNFIRLVKSPKKRKLGLMPRGTYKTTIGTVCNCVQKILNDPNRRILIDSEVLSNSIKFLDSIKLGLRSEKFRELYGNLISTKHRETAQEFTVNTRTDNTLKEPTITATGIGTVNVGMHYTDIIVDDPHSEKNTGTKDQIDKVRDHYRLLLSLLEPGGEMCIWGTRWHFYDLYDYLLEEEIPRNEHIWDVLVEKAIRDDGSLFFPKRLTKAFLTEQRNAKGSYLFSCQYQNSPVSEEAQCFKKTFFKYWNGDNYPIQDGKRILLNIYVLVDRAFSSKATADFTGVMVVGVSNSGNLYVLEAQRLKCGLQDLIEHIWRYQEKYGAERIKKVGIETINWEEAEQFFQEQMRKRNKYFILERLKPDSRQSKNDRIETALQARYANGAIYHKKRMVEFEDELLRFPVGTHDDMIDAFAYLPQLMVIPGNPSVETDEIEYQPSGWFGKTGY